MPVETVRVSDRGRDQLLTLKRRTKIRNWNTLCRWAFCVSLAEPSVPPKTDLSNDSNVEMTWRTFSGGLDELYWALLVHRCLLDGLPTDEATLAEQFRLHLHRGLGYLYGSKELKDISDLIGLVQTD